MTDTLQICENGIIRDATPDKIAEIEARKAKYEEMAPVYAREARNRLLAETDWTQLPDVPEATRNAYTAYRQALRDVPAQEGFPNDIVWPVAPGA